MKILQSVQNDYPILGLHFIDQPIRNYYALNKRNLQAFIMLSLAITSSIVYFFHVAKEIDEFTISFFVTTSFIVIAIVYGIVLWNRKSIFELVNVVEKLVNESMYFISNSQHI